METTTTHPVIVPEVGARVRVEPAGGRDAEEDRYGYLATIVGVHPADALVSACLDVEVAALIDENGDAITNGCPFTWSLYDSEQAAGTWTVVL
jgi:hypothetical protein